MASKIADFGKKLFSLSIYLYLTQNKLKFVDFDRGWMRSQKEWYEFEYAAEKTAAVTRKKSRKTQLS